MNNNRWIFLRGLGRGNVHWADFPTLFQVYNPEAEVEFLEIPGNGVRFNEKTPVDCLKLLESLRQESRFVRSHKSFNLCGISLGGMIAMKWAESFSKEVESIAIINSSLGQFSAFDKRLMPNNYEILLKTFFMNDPYEQEKSILKITSNKFEEKNKYLELFAEFAKSHKTTKMNFLRQLLLARSIHIDSVPLIPFKIISSRRDRLVHSSCSDDIAAHFGGSQYIHQIAGHDLPLDAPDWLSEILIKNLN